MVKLVKFHMLSHRESCKRHDTLVVVRGQGLEKVVGWSLDHGLVRGKRGGKVGIVGGLMKDRDT